MITKNDRLSSSLRDPATLALAVLVDRFRGMPKEDKDDLFELVKALFAAQSPEEVESACEAMFEIVEQTPDKVVRFNLSEASNKSLESWVEFIAARIKALRKAAGMTQEQLAEKTGLPQSHISRLENCEHSPSFVTLEKIARALGVAASELDPNAPDEEADE